MNVFQTTELDYRGINGHGRAATEVPAPAVEDFQYRFPDIDWSLNKLAPDSKRNQDHGMRIENRFGRLCGSSVQCVSVVLTFAFCASAFADPSKNVVRPARSQPAVKTAKKICYAFTTTSGIPVPCDRVSPIPTTASPMTIYTNVVPK
ncbi:MAG: hypothetical protein DMF26_03660 [Verrucomicrobia bacterium]|nr:MAG: hypothetical protein DMF26_03660 [Verrucomicrobiota bacterium]